MIDSTSSPSSLPEGQGDGTEISILQSHGWFPSHSVPPFRASKIYLINIKYGIIERGVLLVLKHLYLSITWEIPRVLGILYQKWGWKSNIFLVIKNNITVSFVYN